ncbi:hypothetical protein FR483_n825R [Paramecium bursaria Chlorella virus FR483]|uniref:Uncharacterized protein n825R n=1 Tax=Paramecium bursaria Chlorella virus FR483 TaxID=399781 RepID=A7J8H9_PBCVF|nr:hypothetical protein FR483_n825R [Paramecium bursaria Chlorella virus FR483]ABT16110.1 hypothetical protein FR483_n825R [Paramecium bursaria Chlorella virus FR483]
MLFDPGDPKVHKREPHTILVHQPTKSNQSPHQSNQQKQLWCPLVLPSTFSGSPRALTSSPPLRRLSSTAMSARRCTTIPRARG